MAAAGPVFADRGIIGASVEEICEAAGFTRGAFYSNFADKDALVLALIQAEHRGPVRGRRAGDRRDEVRPRRADPRGAGVLALTAFELVRPVRSETRARRAGAAALRAREPELREPYLAFAGRVRRQFAALIADAMRSASWSSPCRSPDAIELLTAAHSHMQLQSLFTGSLDSRILHSLLMAITRPTGAQPDAVTITEGV